MVNPLEEVHERFEAALANMKATQLGKTHAMLINNQDVIAESTYENRSPINRYWLLAKWQAGTSQHVEAAMASARAAFPAWSTTDWRERVRLVRRAAEIIESRQSELGVATSLNTGKTRMESLADVQEAADLLRSPCEWMERNNGYIVELGRDPLPGYTVRNFSVMKPYGAWLIISPFNFPLALTCGPAGAALAAGNTVVTKPSVETSWVVRLLAECFRDAGFPDGVFNYVTGKDDELGKLLVDHPDVDGVTFTGSYAVGMEIYRKFAQRDYPRPVVLEMGGKNATVVSRNANLDHAALGIVRAAFGAAGQKCSCTSGVYAEAPLSATARNWQERGTC
jgi:1-pyrroline-5-carboxylate dehydrogenase